MAQTVTVDSAGSAMKVYDSEPEGEARAKDAGRRTVDWFDAHLAEA